MVVLALFSSKFKHNEREYFFRLLKISVIAEIPKNLIIYAIRFNTPPLVGGRPVLEQF